MLWMGVRVQKWVPGRDLHERLKDQCRSYPSGTGPKGGIRSAGIESSTPIAVGSRYYRGRNDRHLPCSGAEFRVR